MAPPSLFQTMRTYWKTSLVVTPALGAAVYFTYEHILNRDMMRYHCLKASEIGDKKISSAVQPKQVTVVLNPAAGKRKSKKLFEKWSEPLLNLAGIKFSIIETQNKTDEIFDMKKILADCDGVAIVGGDGTVEETLAGLVEQGSDNYDVSSKYPIAIIPTGQENTIAKKIHNKLDYRNQKEFIVKSTMRVISRVSEEPRS